MRVISIEMATTTTGKPYKKCKLDQQINGKDQFNVFNFHTRFAEVVEGLELDAMELEMQGQYLNLKDPDKAVSGRYTKSGGAKAGLERKGAMISEAQDKRDLAMRLAGSARDATLIVTTFGKGLTSDTDVKEAWTKWRKWLYEQHDIRDLEDPFDKM